MRLRSFFAVAAIFGWFGCDGVRAQDNTVQVCISGVCHTWTIPTSVKSLTCLKTTLNPAGDSDTCTVTIALPAPAGGYSVTPISTATTGTVTLTPSTLVIQAGQTSGTFTMAWKPPGQSTPAVKP